MLKLLLGADLIMILTFVFKVSTMPPQIPLFYTNLWGEGQLADTWIIFILPLFLNVLYFFNQYILNKFFSNNEFIKKIFYFLNLFLIVSFTLVFIKIVFLVS
jgi:hypothetical protein